MKNETDLLSQNKRIKKANNKEMWIEITGIRIKIAIGFSKEGVFNDWFCLKICF